MTTTTLRDFGLRIGDLEAGPRCSIADVDGFAWAMRPLFATSPSRRTGAVWRAPA